MKISDVIEFHGRKPSRNTTNKKFSSFSYERHYFVLVVTSWAFVLSDMSDELQCCALRGNTKEAPNCQSQIVSH
jgi:hypothetical protein